MDVIVKMFLVRDRTVEETRNTVTISHSWLIIITHERVFRAK